jgi:hypothetical protein|tara:strand:+ start:344 stop:991 length:648 start_codon:yes stop_codon:yes gene_type:complete
MTLIKKYGKLNITIFRFIWLNILFIKSYKLFKKYKYDKFVHKNLILPIFLDFSKVERYDFNIITTPMKYDIKLFFIFQILFDIFDIYIEKNTSNLTSSLVHHFLVVIGFTGVVLFGDTSHAIPLLITTTTQFTAAYAFTLRKILRYMKTPKNIFLTHQRLMTLSQIFIRIPMLYYVISYVLSILCYTEINKKLHLFSLLGYSIQFINEFVWLAHP